MWARLTGDPAAPRTPGYRTVAFTIAVTTLAAKMAKADGVALPVEERAFERVFNIPAGEKANFRRLFDLAAQDIAGYEIYAGRIARLLADEPEMLRALLECLFHVAAADGVLHPDEDKFLSVVAEKFGLSRGEFLSVRAGFIKDPCSPYTILGVHPDITDAELKLRHRALVREHHPDKLAATGVPPELRCAANRRLAAINAAYDEIVADRRGGDCAMILKADSPLVQALHPSCNTGDRRKGCRADMIVLHYTGMPSAEKAVLWLANSRSNVSCHYVIDEAGQITQMVAENQRAWHAGISHWAGETDINSVSIGIEIQNPGHEHGYPEFPAEQMQAVAALCSDIAHRRGVPRGAHPRAFRRCSRPQDRSGREVRLGVAAKAGRRALGSAGAARYRVRLCTRRR